MERSVVVRYRVLVDDAKAKTKELADATNDVASKAKAVGPAAKQGFSEMLDFADRNNAHLNTMATNIGLVGAGLVAMAALAVKKFADFDQAMSNVIATGDDARENQDALREAAIRAGAETVYSASEAAGAIEELMKAGLTAEDVLGGGLSGALDLAAAGSLAVADAAEITAVSLAQFNLTGEKTRHVADLLAAGAGKATGEVSDMGAALNQAGLVANQTGLTIEETTGGLAAFAKAGLIGSDAGTSFKSMLQRLTPQSAEAKRAMDELGISAYDSQGNFIGLAEFAGNLETAMRDLTPEQRNAAMATIFGSDAVRAASVIYENGEAGIRDWIAAVDDSGYAATTAAAKLDNLKGDWEALMGAVDTALIQGGSGANDVLRGLVQGAESVVDAIGEWPEPILSAITLLAGPAGLGLLGAAGVIKLVTSLGEAKGALDALGLSAGKARIAVAAVGGALALGTLALVAWANRAAEARERTEYFKATLDEFGNATDATAKSLNDLIVTSEVSWWDDWRNGGTSIAETAKKMGLSISDVRGAIENDADAIARVQAGIDSHLDSASFWSEQFGSASTDVGVVASFIEDQNEAFSRSRDEKKELAEANGELAGTEGDLAAATDDSRSALESYTGRLSDGTLTTENYADALKEMLDLKREASGIILSQRDAEVQFEESVQGAKDAIEDQIAELERQYIAQGMGEKAARSRAESEVEAANKLDITTEAGRNNRTALDDIAKSGWSLIESMRANNGTQEELQASMQTTRDRFIEAATAMGLTGEEAEQVANDLGLIPSTVDINVNSNISATQAAIDAFVLKYDGQTIAQATIAVTERLITSGATRGQAAAGARYTAMGLAQTRNQADGGIWDGPRKTYANGGINALGQMVPRVPQIAKGGANILWGEPETGWEAYISGKPSELSRNREIHAEAGRRLGVESVPLSARYATGHITGGTTYANPAAVAPSIVLNTPIEAFMGAAQQIAKETARQIRTQARVESQTAYDSAVSRADAAFSDMAVMRR